MALVRQVVISCVSAVKSFCDKSFWPKKCNPLSQQAFKKKKKVNARNNPDGLFTSTQRKANCIGGTVLCMLLEESYQPEIETAKTRATPPPRVGDWPDRFVTARGGVVGGTACTSCNHCLDVR